MPFLGLAIGLSLVVVFLMAVAAKIGGDDWPN
jgi:hypothetical protein